MRAFESGQIALVLILVMLCAFTLLEAQASAASCCALREGKVAIRQTL